MTLSPRIATITQAANVDPEWYGRLWAERGITPAVIEELGIASIDNGWRYPVDLPDGTTLQRVKTLPSLKGKAAKYCWDGSGKNGVYYHAPDLREAIAAKHGELWIVTEADLWAMLSAGIRNTAAIVGSEVTPPADLPAFVERFGVKRIRIAPDLDKPGDKWASNIATTLHYDHTTSVKLTVYRLPSSLGDKGDVGKLWLSLRDSCIDDDPHIVPPFEEALWSLEQYTPTITEPPDLPREYDGDNFADFHELSKAIAGRLGARSTGRAWSKLVRCPFHEDDHASASWNFAGHALNCFVCGWHGAIETADKLSIPHQTITPRILRLELPTTAREALLRRKLATLARTLDALYRAGFRGGDAVAASDVVRVVGCKKLTAEKTLRTTVETPPTKDGTPSEDLPRPNGPAQILVEGDTFQAAGLVFAESSPYFFKTIVTRTFGQKLNTGKHAGGRPRKPELVGIMPAPSEVCALLGVEAAVYDMLPKEALTSNKLYRVAIHKALIARKPGVHSRAFLAGRLGVSKRHNRRYDKLGGIEAIPRHSQEKVLLDQVEAFPEARQGGEWLENAEGKRYPSCRKSLIKIFATEAKAGRDPVVYRCQVLPNEYKLATEGTKQ